MKLTLQAMRKKLPPPENTLSQPGPSQASQQQDYLAPEDYVAQDEIFKVRPALLLIFRMLGCAWSVLPVLSPARCQTSRLRCKIRLQHGDLLQKGFLLAPVGSQSGVPVVCTTGNAGGVEYP